MPYAVRYLAAARRGIGRLPEEVQRRIITHLDALEHNPLPPGALQLANQPHMFRIRIGDYRVIYSVDSHDQLIIVETIGHRKDVYRRR